MNVRKYTFAFILGSFVSTVALAQAPASAAQQPVEKSAVTQSNTDMKHKGTANGATATATTAEKSTESKSVGATHDGKHVAKASKTEKSETVVTKKQEPAKTVEKSQDVKPATLQNSSK